MIERLTVDEIYAHPGFMDMIEEYASITDPLLPHPPSPHSRKHNYDHLEKLNLLSVYGAVVSGRLVGFATCLNGVIPHYGSAIAIVESLYLMRAHRRSGLGLRLIEACEDCARIWGLHQIFVQVHEEELKTLGVILERRNYSARIHTYGRRL